MTRVTAAGLLAIGLAVACAQAMLPVPTAADARRLEPTWPEASVEALAEGRRLYLSHCGSCHRPYEPGAHTADQWAIEVPEMRERSHLDAARADKVLRYLQAFARPGP